MAAMVRLTLLLLLRVGVTLSTAVDLQKRIIGGQPCERRYHVTLTAAAGGSNSLCGGSLVSDRWVLTAAHCWKPRRAMLANVGLHPGGPAQEVHITAEPVIYRDRDERPHDLMLLQLPSPSDVPPVALPDCEHRPEMVEIAGHGATTGGPNDERKAAASAALHCAHMEVVNCKDLEETLRKVSQKVYEVKMYQHWFCGGTPATDICYGDSGGGVVHKDQIYGVISFLGDPDHVCRKAAAFMDLCNPAYAAWINQTIT